MSYCVEYNPEMRKNYPVTYKRKRKSTVRIVVCGAAIVLSFYALLSGGILRFLIPGDPEVTSAAFSSLVTKIGGGEPVKDAIVTFCRDIVVNGQ